MKKFLVSLVFSSIVFAGFADLQGNGYYRVKNYGSSRWASLIDNKADIDVGSNSADLHAMQLSKDTEAMLSDPGSIVYISNVSQSQYNVSAQGVTLSQLVDKPINIKVASTADGQTNYYIYGTYASQVKYIGDNNLITADTYGYASLNVVNAKFKQWLIIPVNVNSDNFYGVVPSIDVNNKLYTTNFTAFAYQPYSQGVKAYYISRVYKDKAEMIEITGAVPSGSPVIIQCVGSQASDNKMNIVESAGTLPGNALAGTYFNFHNKNYTTRVPYDPETMRVLGSCSDGSLGFIVAEGLDFIPANTAYLKVAAGSPEEIKCVSSQEFEAAGIDSVIINQEGIKYNGSTLTTNDSNVITVVNLAGQTMLTSNSGSLDVASLPKGIYIASAGGKSLKIVR